MIRHFRRFGWPVSIDCRRIGCIGSTAEHILLRFGVNSLLLFAFGACYSLGLPDGFPVHQIRTGHKVVGFLMALRFDYVLINESHFCLSYFFLCCYWSLHLFLLIFVVIRDIFLFGNVKFGGSDFDGFFWPHLVWASLGACCCCCCCCYQRAQVGTGSFFFLFFSFEDTHCCWAFHLGGEGQRCRPPT